MARIVVADDEPEIRNAIVGIVQEAGHEVQEAFDGISALDAVKSFKPNLLLVDWMIPELFGGEVIEKLRNDDEYSDFKDLPILVVSDFDDDGSVKKFMAAGATGFVPKKDNPDELRRLLLERISELNLEEA